MSSLHNSGGSLTPEKLATYKKTFEPGKMYMLQSHYGWPTSFLLAEKKYDHGKTDHYWDMIRSSHPSGGYESLVVDEPTPFIVIDDFGADVDPGGFSETKGTPFGVVANYITGLVGEKVCFISKLDIGLRVELPPPEEQEQQQREAR